MTNPFAFCFFLARRTETAGRIELAFWQGGFLRPHCYKKSVISKIRALFSISLEICPKLWTLKTLTTTRLIVATCCQLISTKVDVYWDKQDRRRLNKVDITCDGRQSIDDLDQFIILSVHPCLQHDAHKAWHRTGPSATAGVLVANWWHR